MSRARRPHFGFTEQKELLDQLGRARHGVSLCGGAAGFGTSRHNKCDALNKAIDDLAEELTGRREYFWTFGHGTGPLDWSREGGG
jgi:hypothetical protein